jgi:hypothetical protein
MYTVVACPSPSPLVLDTPDLTPKNARARGTKGWNRDRMARLAEWTWPFFERHLARVFPGERVLRGVDRWEASDTHRERLRALGLSGYTLHDARHHWACEWR